MSPTGQLSSRVSWRTNMPKPIHGLLDNFIEQFASAIAARAEQMFARSAFARGGRRTGIRMCPFPGCKHAGAGPRNRWFCREHARSVHGRVQKWNLAERAKETQEAASIDRHMRCSG